MRNLAIVYQRFSEEDMRTANELGVNPADSIQYRAGLALKRLQSLGSVGLIIGGAIDYADGKLDHAPTLWGGALVTVAIAATGSYLMAGPLQTARDAVDDYRQQR